jgi:hypothetical protein
MSVMLLPFVGNYIKVQSSRLQHHLIWWHPPTFQRNLVDIYQTTQCYNPDNPTIRSQSYGNLESNIKYSSEMAFFGILFISSFEKSFHWFKLKWRGIKTDKRETHTHYGDLVSQFLFIRKESILKMYQYECTHKELYQYNFILHGQKL